MTSRPLIPYVQLPDLTLLEPGALGNGFPPAPFSFKPFGTLVAMGVYLGAYLAVRHGRRRGLDEKKLISFMMWIGAMGFIGGHVFDTLFYFPERVLADPLSLVRIWEGLSSFGGFAGAFIGLLIWRALNREPSLRYADVVAATFPVGWWFGRLGCSLAHDHPGILSDAWLAVRYPGGARLDLGFLEMLLTIPLAVLFLVLARKPRPWGFYLGSMCVAYAPTRFALDFLRIRQGAVADARYFELSPAQWGCFLLLGAGVAVLWKGLRASDTAPRASAREALVKPGS